MKESKDEGGKLIHLSSSLLFSRPSSSCIYEEWEKNKGPKVTKAFHQVSLLIASDD